MSEERRTIPVEAIELYNRFIHGEIGRRAFLEGCKKFAIVGLSASAIDQYRGTDYFLVTPGYLRRIAKLPAPLGQSIYVGGTYEFGQMRAPDAATVTRQDIYFGVVAETPFGVFTFAPAIGSNGERKLTFTVGRIF